MMNRFLYPDLRTIVVPSKNAIKLPHLFLDYIPVFRIYIIPMTVQRQRRWGLCITEHKSRPARISPFRGSLPCRLPWCYTRIAGKIGTNKMAPRKWFNPVPQAGRVTLARGGFCARFEIPFCCWGLSTAAPKSLVRYENGAPIFEKNGESRERKREMKRRIKIRWSTGGFTPLPPAEGIPSFPILLWI